MAAKNAFALLRLQDGEEPEKALENNVQQYKKDIETAKAKAKAPKYEKQAAKEPAQQKHRNDKPRKDGEQRERRAPRESNGERGDHRGPRRDGEPARRGDGVVHRERPEGKGNRPPRRENDRKSASGRNRQGEKTREESKLNLGKASEAEADAAADADADAENKEEAAPAGEDAVEEPEEPKEVTLTLDEYKASLKGDKAVAKRMAGEGEDKSKFKSSDVIVKEDGMKIVDANAVSASAKSRRGQKKIKEQAKTVDLKLNFYQHDKGDERPYRERREPRESRAPGSERGAPREREDRRQSGPRQPRQQGSQRGASARTPDFNNAAAFPALG